MSSEGGWFGDTVDASTGNWIQNWVYNQNFLPISKKISYGMAVDRERNRLYVSDHKNGKIHIVGTDTIKKKDAFGDFQTEGKRTTHPLSLDVAPDGSIWNVQETLERTYGEASGLAVTGALSTSNDIRAGDGIHVVYVPVTGDTEITARIQLVRPQTHKDPLAGIIHLDRLEKGTRFSWMRLIHRKTSRFVRVNEANGDMNWAGTGDLSEPPVWYRLRKNRKQGHLLGIG